MNQNLSLFAGAAVAGFAVLYALENVAGISISHHAGGFPGQSLHTGCADCINAGANPACCAAALKHGNPRAGVMKGYYINNCKNCNQPECSGKNEYPTGTAGTCTTTSASLTAGS